MGPQGVPRAYAQWEESFSKHLEFAIVITFWLKWAGYLAVAGLNLHTLLSYRTVQIELKNLLHCSTSSM